jgi:hypothetical protein
VLFEELHASIGDLTVVNAILLVTFSTIEFNASFTKLGTVSIFKEYRFCI